MATMFDSINLDAIPADATDILIYSDGIHAETAAEVKARWPNATYHTISAVGQVPAQWIDCEVGCVWPPSAAAAKLKEWQAQGCEGIYGSLNNMPEIKAAVVADPPPQPTKVMYFDADYTQVEHIDAGYVATQFADPGPYDETDTSAAFEAGQTTGDDNVRVIEDANKTFIGLDGPLMVTPLTGAEVAWANATYGPTQTGMPNTLIDRIDAQVSGALAGLTTTAAAIQSSLNGLEAAVNALTTAVAAIQTAVAAIPTTATPVSLKGETATITFS